MPQYSEEWSITISRKEFVIDEGEKSKLEKAMQDGDRWFKTKLGDILSVAHIECVVLRSKTIKNQLEAPKEEYIPIPNDKFQKLKKEALSKIGK